MLNPDEFIIIDLKKTRLTWRVFKYWRESQTIIFIGNCDCARMNLLKTVAQQFGGGDFLAAAYPLGKTEARHVEPIEAQFLSMLGDDIGVKPLPRKFVRCLYDGEGIEELHQYIQSLFSPESEQPSQTKGAPRNPVYDKVEKLVAEGMTIRKALIETDPEFLTLPADERKTSFKRLCDALRERGKTRVRARKKKAT